MKTINETFEDQEFELLKAKKGKKKTWHNFIMELVEDG